VYLDTLVALRWAHVHAAVGMKYVPGPALQTGLDKLHVPYSYGWSIILLTLLVKTALFAITRKQVSFREEHSLLACCGIDARRTWVLLLLLSTTPAS